MSIMDGFAASVGPEFHAMYPGYCADGDRIHPGELVRYVDGELTHVECTVVEEKPFEACPKCFVSPCDCEVG